MHVTRVSIQPRTSIAATPEDSLTASPERHHAIYGGAPFGAGVDAREEHTFPSQAA